ncbi:MAG: hypothetical protein CM1200mP3_08230 [Chloroflexota bacterium]|nr:MAG: hypothetical protein CM1200mP3_08230 [Chloroflexota bacterium]
MKAVLIREQGGRENLKLEEIEKPIPASGEILVRVKACSLNYLEFSLEGACLVSRWIYRE